MIIKNLVNPKQHMKRQHIKSDDLEKNDIFYTTYDVKFYCYLKKRKIERCIQNSRSNNNRYLLF